MSELNQTPDDDIQAMADAALAASAADAKAAPAAAEEGISQALARAMAKPEVRERLGQLGLAVDVMNPAQLATREAAYTRNWAEIIKRSGFQPQ